MPARLEVVKDVTGQRIYIDPVPTEGRPSATPTAEILAKDFSSSTDRAAANTYVTQDTVNTTSNGAVAAAATSITLDSVTGITWRSTYRLTNSLLQYEDVRVKSVNSSTLAVGLDEPLKYAHADAATFQGLGFYYTLQSGDVDTLGEGYRCRFRYVVNSVTYIRDVAFDVVLVKLENPLSVEFVRERRSGIKAFEPSQTRGTFYQALREAAWDRVQKAIRDEGTEPHQWRPSLLKTPDDIEDWALAELDLLLWRNGVDVLPGAWDPERGLEYLKNEANAMRSKSLASLEWMDVNDDDSRANDEERPAKRAHFVR